MVKHFNITATIILHAGENIVTADIDRVSDLGPHQFSLIARDEKHAEELALDILHDTIAIGNLEAVWIDVQTVETKKRKNRARHLRQLYDELGAVLMHDCFIGG